MKLQVAAAAIIIILSILQIPWLIVSAFPVQTRLLPVWLPFHHNHPHSLLLPLNFYKLPQQHWQFLLLTVLALLPQSLVEVPLQSTTPRPCYRYAIVPSFIIHSPGLSNPESEVKLAHPSLIHKICRSAHCSSSKAPQQNRRICQ